MNQINYDRQMQAQIGSLPSGSRPTLLLHSCCGPCSSAVLERLAPHFDITVFFYNPNILPQEEYQHRLREQRRLLRHMVLPWPIALWEGPYEPDAFSIRPRVWQTSRREAADVRPVFLSAYSAPPKQRPPMALIFLPQPCPSARTKTPCSSTRSARPCKRNPVAFYLRISKSAAATSVRLPYPANTGSTGSATADAPFPFASLACGRSLFMIKCLSGSAAALPFYSLSGVPVRYAFLLRFLKRRGNSYGLCQDPIGRG